MAASGAMLPAAARMRRWLSNSMVPAIEKLMGLVLAVALEMILAGLKHYLFGTN